MMIKKLAFTLFGSFVLSTGIIACGGVESVESVEGEETGRAQSALYDFSNCTLKSPLADCHKRVDGAMRNGYQDTCGRCITDAIPRTQ